jgi:hypothetical protein
MIYERKLRGKKWTSCQGRIKGFVGHRHFSSEGPFGNWKSIVATTVYSQLSGLMEGQGMHRYLRNVDNPNFIF